MLRLNQHVGVPLRIPPFPPLLTFYELAAARAGPGPAWARRWPPYAACAALELFESPGSESARDGQAGGGHVVRLRYQDRPVGMFGHGRPARANPHAHPSAPARAQMRAHRQPRPGRQHIGQARREALGPLTGSARRAITVTAS